jgi:hypothetical protein
MILSLSNSFRYSSFNGFARLQNSGLAEQGPFNIYLEGLGNHDPSTTKLSKSLAKRDLCDEVYAILE